MSHDTPQSVAVIGGGVIGAMSAWYLADAGLRVTIIDRERFGAACSHGNCGYICPSHVLPLAQPGAIAATLPKLLNRNSPLRIKPRLSAGLYRWLYHFSRRCNQAHMMEAASARHALLQSSIEHYRQLIRTESIDCQWQARGLLFVFDTEAAFEHYRQTDQLLTEEFGVAATAYDAAALTDLEPALKPGLGGGWHYEADCHIRPDLLMQSLRAKLAAKGVTILEQAPVSGFVGDRHGRAAALVASQAVEADAFVVATGAMTPFLNRHLGCRIPIEPGKGYSVTMPSPAGMPRIPMIFEESHVAVTPLGSSFRIGSTMEFVGYDRSIPPPRIEMLRSAAEQYLHDPHCDPIESQWYGWRPMTWDGKPIIDRSPKYQNVWIAAGHSMLGLSMAAGTGKLVQELVCNEPPHLDVAPFSVSRFG
jgi:D-amino-acid dehydrogenase